MATTTGDRLHVMKPAQPLRRPVSSHAQAAWERRRRAAWIDYLRSTREADSASYEHSETESWERLQRRLRRNDELLAEGRP